MSVVPRLVLGTVQFGVPYGRRSSLTPLPLAEVYAILDEAWAIGIRAFDTAEAYGEACTRLGAWIGERAVASEVLIVSKARVDDLAAFEERARAAVKPFVGVGHLTLLSHGAVSLDAWSQFRDVALSLNAAAGQSVYTASEVSAAAAMPSVSRIQAPANVFDRRALDARTARFVPLDLRSAYLQGVLLEHPRDAERRAPGAGVLAESVARAAAEVGEDAASLLLAAVLAQLRAEDRVVVGIDRAAEVASLSHALDVPAEAVDRFRRRLGAGLPGEPDPATLDPRTWPRNPATGEAASA